MATKRIEAEAGTGERIPKAQLLLDDVFLLFAAGLIVPTVFYVVWGLVSLLSVPPFGR